MFSLLANANEPFAIALMVLFLVALAQVIGLGDLLGDADGDVDGDAAADVDGSTGIGSSIASLVGIGRLPFLIWLSLMLAVFSGIGFTGQQIIAALFGAPLGQVSATIAALALAFPITGLVARPLARIIPRDETTAVAIDTLVGRRGRIAIGNARRGSAARAAIPDQHGYVHHVMVEPHDDDAAFAAGDEVLLVRRERETFFAIGQADRRLTP